MEFHQNVQNADQNDHFINLKKQVSQCMIIVDIYKYLDRTTQLNLSSCNRYLFKLLVTDFKKCRVEVQTIDSLQNKNLKRNYQITDVCDCWDVKKLNAIIVQQIDIQNLHIKGCDQIDFINEILERIQIENVYFDIKIYSHYYQIIEKVYYDKPINLFFKVYKQNNLTNEDLKYLMRVKSNVDISGCKIVDEGIKYLVNMNKYLSLLDCCQITDKEVQYLANMERGLNLSNCYKITDKGLQYLINMESSLNLSGCVQITNEGLKYLTNLKIGLNLSGCDITDEGLGWLANMTGYLCLKGCNITNEGLKYLANIKNGLNISNCIQITDEGLKYLSHIESYLNLSGCVQITDEGLKHLINIECGLILHGCYNITDEGYKYLDSRRIKYRK